MSLPITKELVIKQFEADSTWRKIKWCPLVPLDSVLKMGSKFRRSYSSTVNGNRPISFRQYTDVAIFPSSLFMGPIHGTESVIEAIETKFEIMTDLIEEFLGELILAGGCLARAILCSDSSCRIEHNCDADFFFINCTKERILQILDLIENMFRQQYENKAVVYKRTNTFERRNGSVRRVTSLRTTSFVINKRGLGMGINSIKYQFIHSRSYPSEEAVLLGFDIPASSILYNGRTISMTPMAAFTIATGVIFIDPSRRSTTYEKRLLKYSREMHLALGTIATTTKKIKQGYIGRRELGARRIEHELVPGIKITIDATGNTDLRSTNWALERDNMFGDYGAEAINEYMVKLHNGFFALHDQPENIAWIKRKSDQNDLQIEAIYPKIDPWNENGEQRIETSEVVAFVPQDTIKELLGFKIKGHSVQRSVIGPVLHFLRERAETTLDCVTKRLKENDFEYIGPNDNPGRQHTASFNPVYGDVRDYWFYHFYDVTTIGFENESYFVLKCVLKQYGAYDRGILKLIVGFLMVRRACDILTDLEKPGELEQIIPEEYDRFSSDEEWVTESGRPQCATYEEFDEKPEILQEEPSIPRKNLTLERILAQRKAKLEENS